MCPCCEIGGNIAWSKGQRIAKHPRSILYPQADPVSPPPCRNNLMLHTPHRARFDHLNQPRDGSALFPGAASLPAPLTRGELRRLRLSDQSLDWEAGGGRGWGGSSSGGGGDGDDEDFASAWGGSSWGGCGGGGSDREGGSAAGGGGGGGRGGRWPGGRSSRSSSFASAAGSVSSLLHPGDRVSRTLSGESEFYDASDGESDGEIGPPARGPGKAGGGVPAPQPGGEDTGSGEEGWSVGALAAPGAHTSAADGGSDGGGGRGAGLDESSEGDDDESLEFQDARDPVSEVKQTFAARAQQGVVRFGGRREGGELCWEMA